VLRGVRNDRKAGCYQCSPGVEQARVLQASGVLIGVGSRRRSASQAIDLPSDGGGNAVGNPPWSEDTRVMQLLPVLPRQRRRADLSPCSSRDATADLMRHIRSECRLLYRRHRTLDLTPLRPDTGGWRQRGSSPISALSEGGNTMITISSSNHLDQCVRCRAGKPATAR
jgi:hypothetical protein